MRPSLRAARLDLSPSGQSSDNRDVLYPKTGPPHQRWGFGFDGMPVEESFQVVCKMSRGFVTQVWLLFKTLADDRLKIDMDVGLLLPDLRRRPIDYQHNRLHYRFGLKRGLASEQRKKNRPHGIHIGCDPLSLALSCRLLWRHIARRSNRRPSGRQTLFGTHLLG